MRWCIILLLIVISQITYAQPYQVSGTVTDDHNQPLQSVTIDIVKNDTLKNRSLTNKNGKFSIRDLNTGLYIIRITYPGYTLLTKSVNITQTSIDIDTITLKPLTVLLDEVRIINQALAIVQKDDTMEYNSSAYKLNPDADAIDLVRKMPSIELDGKSVTAQGKSVVKVLVDGKPFFGNDPYATLKNLPAYIVNKVQVYNEKSEQEQLTGFSEGPVSKTINIITHENMRKGLFGNASAGAGADNNGQGVYGAGLTANRFDGARRISLISQANNVNTQNFTEQSPSSGVGSGITATKAAAINYSDKWGKKTDISASYRYTVTDNSVSRETERQYILPSGAGQIYNEHSPSSANNNAHQANMRMSVIIDSMNTISFQPSFTFTESNRKNITQGVTSTGTELLNSISNSQSTAQHLSATTAYLMYMRKFHKKGRTLSAGGNIGYNSNIGLTNQYAGRLFYNSPMLSDTLDQLITDSVRSLSITGNVTYTTPVGKNGIIKLQYNLSHMPSSSTRIAYNSEAGLYSLSDSLLSGSFTSTYTAHKPGMSYMFKRDKYELSLGVDYQAAILSNVAQMPASNRFRRPFSNLLPVASVKYRMSRTDNLQCSYNTSTTTPAVTQLQNIVNNTDPLHLSTGNPELRQPYSHSVSLGFTSSAITTGRFLSIMLSGSLYQSAIATSSFTSITDTMYANVLLPAGAQLSMPVNINGNQSLMTNASYSRRIKPLKCLLNINANANLYRMPSVINDVINYQQNKNMGLSASLNSTVNESIDFTLGTNTSVIASSSTANPLLNSTYLNQSYRAMINIIAHKSWIINSSATYQANLGTAAGFNNNFLVWNMAIGRKFFKKKQGNLSLLVFDILNENKSIRRTVTDNFIQDTRNNLLQRYAMLSFTYKFSTFGK